MGYTNVKIILLIRQGFNKIGNGFVTVSPMFNGKSNSLFAQRSGNTAFTAIDPA
jgi:hypothetical protein